MNRSLIWGYIYGPVVLGSLGAGAAIAGANLVGISMVVTAACWLIWSRLTLRRFRSYHASIGLYVKALNEEFGNEKGDERNERARIAAAHERWLEAVPPRSMRSEHREVGDALSRLVKSPGDETAGRELTNAWDDLQDRFEAIARG